MPIYEYKCNTCDNIFEHLFTTKDINEKFVCPKCKSLDFYRILSVSNFRMYGGGVHKPNSK